MTAPTGAIVRRGGISRTVFVLSLVIVAAASGVSGYVIQGILHPAPPVITFNGAGSTFVAPLLQAMDFAYSQTITNVQINYQPVGSGAGINQLIAKTVDFGASDAPLTPNQLNSTQTGTTSSGLTIPDTVGAVVVAYNLPGILKGLQLNENVTAKIFQGNITMWSDPEIHNLNTALSLPSQPITIVHRFDSSGTTFVFSGYLKSSPFWKLGQAKSITWPTSVAEYGNQGVASYVQGTKYSIGYVELDYALSVTPPMTYGYIWNKAGGGGYVEPTLNSTALAVNSISSLPAGNANWKSVSLLNANVAGAYPISTFSYIMVYPELNAYGSSMSLTRAQALVSYLWYVVHDGQNQAKPLSYAPLPSIVVQNAEATIRSITYNGATLHA